MRVELGDICEVKSGKRLPQGRNLVKENTGFPYLRLVDCGEKYPIENNIHFLEKDVYEKIKQYKIFTNEVFLSVVGTIGIVGIIPEKFNGINLTENANKLVIKEEYKDKVNAEYLYYWLKSNTGQNAINKGIVGSIQPKLPMYNIEKFEIDLPNRKIQDKIVEILSGIDEQIVRNNAITKKLQVLGNTIYSDAFKNCNATCSLVDLPHIQLIKQGIDKFAGEKHYVATADVTNDNLNFDAQKITFDNREGRANMQPVKNSVWFAQMKNSIKHIFISNNDDYLVDNYIFSTGFYGFECDEIAYEFMIGTLSLPYFEQIKDKMANGAIMASINSDSLNLIKIPMPTKEQLSSYHEKTKYIYMQISAIKTENYKLSKLKERLLPLLINGQLSS